MMLRVFGGVAAQEIRQLAIIINDLPFNGYTGELTLEEQAPSV